MENYMKTLSQVLQEQKENGYEKDFEWIDNKLVSTETNEAFKPDDLTIEKVFRFEGESDPGDMSVLYSIRAKSGTKGTLIDAYGTYDNTKLSEFLKDVIIEEDAHR
jgi:hypothetical protein